MFKKKKAPNTTALTLTNNHIVDQYVRKVLSGELVACNYVKLACRRYTKDLVLSEQDDFKYYLDRETGQRIIDFFEHFLIHSVGDKDNKHFILEPWQQFILFNLFGWKKKKDGLRRYTDAYISVARKNGKSTMFGGLGLFMAGFDINPKSGRPEAGARVFSAATKKEQAKEIWNEAKRMVNKSTALQGVFEVHRNSIFILDTSSSFIPLSNEGKTGSGKNAHCSLVDELHEHADAELWAKLDTSAGSRSQSLIATITTAGFDKHTLCWDRREYAIRTLELENVGPRLFVFIATLDDGDDWKDKKNWPKSNPNIDLPGNWLLDNGSVNVENMEDQFKKALDMPSEQNSFKRFKMNMWTESESVFIELEKWQACVISEPEFPTEAELAKMQCWDGLDCASVRDLSSRAILFSPDFHNEKCKIYVKSHAWCPKERLLVRSKNEGIPYDYWAKRGWITPTPGAQIDHDYIYDAVYNDSQDYNLLECGYDPNHATQLSIRLSAVNVKMVEIRQGFALSEGIKEILRNVLNKRLTLLPNDMLQWTIQNVVLIEGDMGGVKLTKAKAKEVIDPVVSLARAVHRALASPKKRRSVYKSRGVPAI